MVAVYHSNTWDTDYCWFNGGWVTSKDYVILTRIQQAVRPWWGTLYLSQGGLSGSVAASAKTHFGLGAFDISVYGHSKADVWRLSIILLQCGIVPFPRGWVADSFQSNKHIHAVSYESFKSLHQQAKDQLKAWFGYFHGHNGLAGIPWQLYAGPAAKLIRWAKSTWKATTLSAAVIRPTTDPEPEPEKGWFGMTSLPATERKKPIRLNAGQELVLPIDDEGNPSVITGSTKDFTTKLTVRVTGLPAGQTLSVRAGQFDCKPVGGKLVSTPALFGGLDAQAVTSDGADLRQSFVFDGSVKDPAKGSSRRVRFVAVASADCTISYLSTTGTRKA